MSVIDVCFIGDGSHATRIKKILSDLKVDINLIQHNRLIDIIDQTDVVNSNIIFIMSPNNTHIDYLKKLSKIYKGYVYCEKPPINKYEDFEIFDLINPSKVFFGFNHRFSEFQQFILDTKANYDFGELININIHMSYPFSVKDNYKKSWKSDNTKSPYGVIENLGIHYLDLAVSLMGKVNKVFLNSTNLNNAGTADDTASISLLHENGAASNIFVSYATLAKESLYFTFKSGDISYNGEEFKSYYPRETFNPEGLSICPPVVFSKRIEGELLYLNSLQNCVAYFIEVVLNSDNFNHDLFNQTRISTLAMFGRVEDDKP